MSDAERLQRYVDTWAASCDDVVALLRALPDDAWARPTDLPGWDVKAVAGHLAHLEGELAGETQPPVDLPDLDHVTSPMSAYTEQGPAARSDREPAEIVDELERVVAARHAELAADPPTDGSAPAARTPGALSWDWDTLLSNRVVDVWMHEQDVRRALDLPGGLDTVGAAHTVDVFSRALGFVVAKKAGATVGTSVVVDVTGPVARTLAVHVGDDGRAVPVPPPDDPSLRITLDTEGYVVLSGGRRDPDQVPVDVEGDEALARRILAALAVTF